MGICRRRAYTFDERVIAWFCGILNIRPSRRVHLDSTTRRLESQRERGARPLGCRNARLPTAPDHFPNALSVYRVLQPKGRAYMPGGTVKMYPLADTHRK